MSKNTNKLKTGAPGRFGLALRSELSVDEPSPCPRSSSSDSETYRVNRQPRLPSRHHRVWSKYSQAQGVSSLHLSKGLLESAIAVGYVFQFSGRSCDGLEDHAELHLRIGG